MAVITLYRGARAPTPVDTLDAPWPDVARALEEIANEPPGVPATAGVEDQKKAMLAWAPHALTAGATRGNDGVDHVSLLVVDVDHGPPPEEIAARLRDDGFASLVYESAKSTPDAPRYRIVCPVDEPIPPEHCRATRLAFAQYLGLDPDCGVKGAMDPSKLFFSGRAHDTPHRRVWITDGTSVDSAGLAQLFPATGEWATGPSATTASPHLADLPPADQGLVAALGPWQSHAGRKWSVCGALGGLLRKLAYSPHQCEAAIRAWLPPNDPSVDVEAGVAWALGAWRIDPADASGHGLLAEHVGEQHAEVIETAAVAGSFIGMARVRRPLPLARSDVHPAVPPSGDPLGVRYYHRDPLRPIEYFCEGLRLAPSRGKISMIAGLPGQAKGPLAAHLAVSFALGVPAFGCMPVRHSRVLLLDSEGIDLTMERTHRVAVARGFAPVTLDETLEIRDLSGFGVNVLDDRFFYAIQATGAEALFVDSYTSLMMNTGLDPNKIEFGQLAKILGALGILVVCIAHANKAPEPGVRPTLQQVAGSFALAAMAQTGIVMWRPSEETPDHYNVGCMRAPRRGFESFAVDFCDVEDNGLDVRMVTGAEVKRQTEIAAYAETTRAMNLVLAWLRERPQPWEKKVIQNSVVVHGASATGLLPESQLSGILARMVESGIVTWHPGATAAKGTYQISSVQRGPEAVTIGPVGAVVETAAGFNRS